MKMTVLYIAMAGIMLACGIFCNNLSQMAILKNEMLWSTCCIFSQFCSIAACFMFIFFAILEIIKLIGKQ